MASGFASLDAASRAQLLADMNYLNMSELHGLCRRVGIPWAIYIELPDGRLRRTKDADRKAVVLDRLRQYLQSGRIQGPTVYPASIVSEAPLADEPRPTDRLYYGHYDKQHRGLMHLLGELTDGRFRNGAVARLLCRSYWERGEAPTIAEFAESWSVAAEEGLGIDHGHHPEAAYLTDRARGAAGPHWKDERSRRAARALDLLARLTGTG